MKSKELGKIIAKTDNIVTQELTEELLIYDLEIHKAFNLNQTLALIWQNCDGKKGINEIARALQEKLNKPVDREIVLFGLRELEKEGLVDYDIETPNQLSSLNRRELIRRVGLTSMVALPMVYSLVSPTAVQAQSFVDVCDVGGTGGIGNDPNKTRNGGACKGHGNCCSNNCCAPAGSADGICRAAGTICT